MREKLIGVIAVLFLLLGTASAVALLNNQDYPVTQSDAVNLANKIAGPDYQVAGINFYNIDTNPYWDITMTGPGGTRTIQIDANTWVASQTTTTSTGTQTTPSVQETLGQDYNKYGQGFSLEAFNQNVKLTSSEALAIADTNPIAADAGTLVNTGLINDEGSFVWQFTKQSPSGVETTIQVDASSGSINGISTPTTAVTVSTPTNVQSTLDQEYAEFGGNMDQDTFEQMTRLTSGQALNIANSDPAFADAGSLQSTQFVSNAGTYMWQFTKQSQAGAKTVIQVNAGTGMVENLGPSAPDTTVVLTDPTKLQAALDKDYATYGQGLSQDEFGDAVAMTSGEALDIANSDAAFAHAGTLTSTQLVSNAGNIMWQFTKQSQTGGQVVAQVNANTGMLENIGPTAPSTTVPASAGY
jgi:uncharacterized membrane protein YkoI